MNITQLLAPLLREEASLVAQLAKLRAVKEAISSLSGSPVAPKAPAKGGKPAKKRLRAPAGALDSAIIAAVKHAPWLTNAGIRAALAKSKYEYAIGGPLISKTLSGLKKEGRLVAMETEKGTAYAPIDTPKPA